MRWSVGEPGMLDEEGLQLLGRLCVEISKGVRKAKQAAGYCGVNLPMDPNDPVLTLKWCRLPNGHEGEHSGERSAKHEHNEVPDDAPTDG